MNVRTMLPASQSPLDKSPFRNSPAWRKDLAASLVVFLVALPLCIGVAVASGVPAELGLVTGLVGGLVAGALPGSQFQVSGPAAGLTVLVYETVAQHGLPTLGVIVLAAGLLQVLMGVLRLGGWFRAISAAVVQGMLAGIGLVLITSQVYALVDAKPRGGAVDNLAGLGSLLAAALARPEAWAAAGLGLGTVAVLVGWRFAPARLRMVPAPLVAVAAATAASVAFQAPVERVTVGSVLGTIQFPGAEELARLAEVGVLGSVLAFALIASAESLFSAAAVDRMHDGERTRYDQELLAQGAGNTVCGLLGALPMTAVIVRSAANVQAGASSRASRVLHGVWLLLFAVLVPGLLSVIPLAALAGVLIHAGCKLIPTREIRTLWRADRGEAAVLVVTAAAIVATNLLEGVLLGLLLAVAKTAWDVSHVNIDVDEQPERIRIRLSGNATFLRLPRMLETLERLPSDRPASLDLSGLRHLDHACRAALEGWATRHDGRGSEVDVSEPWETVAAR
jgi:MFS superfamily sulfate permease-like transporter